MMGYLVCTFFTILLLYLSFIFIRFINRKIKVKIKKSCPDLLEFKIRNVDYLIIGDYVNISLPELNKSNCLYLLSPGRSFFSSNLILRRMFSYLKKNGTAIIIVRKKNKGKIKPADFPFLHEITKKQLQISNWGKKQRLPLIYDFKNMIRWLFPPKKINKFSEVANKELNSFCEERDINYKLIVID